MKQNWKRITSVLLIAVFCLAFTACGGKKDAAAGELKDDVKTGLIQSAQSVVQAVVSMDEETIQQYLEAEEAFSRSAMEAWVQNREELGTYTDLAGDAEVDVTSDTIAVHIPVQFEKEDAVFTVNFDKKYNAASMAIEIQYSMATKLERAGMNTVMGLVTVFLVLVFLSFLIYLIRFIPGFVDLFRKKDVIPAQAAPSIPAEEVPSEEDGELAGDGVLVAVIAAAVAASENTSTDGFVVRSIRKSNKKSWQRV